MILLDSQLGENFCYAPWTNIHINTRGEYKTCCAGQTVLGNLHDHSIESILTNPALDEIKTAALNNHSHNNCGICQRQEANSGVSERAWYNDIAGQRTIPIRDITQQHIQNLDIRWSNTCNLSCVYCGSEASSVWSRLINSAEPKQDYGENLGGIIDHIRANPHIQNLALLGGEPLLQRENEELLSAIPESVNINVITNLSVPLEKNKIFQKLATMPNVTWDVSFETVEEKYEYVRHGADWNLLLKNIRVLQQLAQQNPFQSSQQRGHTVGTAGIYHIYNCLELKLLLEYFRDCDLPSIRWTELCWPEPLSAVHLPREFRQQCIEEIDASAALIDNPVQQSFFAGMRGALASALSANTNCDYLYSWHHSQETRYWPDTKLRFEDLWPKFKGVR
jgi:organic radical activating enzyme